MYEYFFITIKGITKIKIFSNFNAFYFYNIISRDYSFVLRNTLYHIIEHLELL